MRWILKTSFFKNNFAQCRVAGWLFVFMFFAWVSVALSVSGSEPAALTSLPRATRLVIKGPIGPATEDFVRRGLEKAARLKHRFCILEIDTPGGLATAMRGIIQSILASPLPVIGYVAPKGARAASAGTYILYASHLAVMAPGTHLGAATPVALGAPDQSPPAQSSPSSSSTPKPSSTSMQKATNDAKAYLISLAELRGRNAQWAAKAVSDSESLSAQAALKLRVIDFIAEDRSELFKKAQGHRVWVNGAQMTLDTEGVQVVTQQPDRLTQFLSIITHPSVAYILMMIGIYGLFFEFLSPGLVIPGVAGTICLLIALYAFQLLPISYAGVGLVLLSFVFFMAEVWSSSTGILAIGGMVSLVMGSVLLFSNAPSQYGFALSKSLIAGVVVSTGLFFLGVAQLVYRAHRPSPVSGQHAMLGKQGHLINEDGKIWVKVDGVLWKLHPDQAVAGLNLDTPVEVTGVEGLALRVQSLDTSKRS